MYAWLLNEPLTSFPTCEAACSLLLRWRFLRRRRRQQIRAATATTRAAAEITTKIYHGVLLDALSANEETEE